MAVSGRVRFARVAVVAALAFAGSRASTQGTVTDPTAKGNLPNPNPTVVKNWGALPDGWVWGSTAGVDVGPDGHVWAYDRCGANTCANSNVAPILSSIGRPASCSPRSAAA
jgi:hypothetical protein